MPLPALPRARKRPFASDMTDSPILSLDSVRHRYGERVVLDVPSLSIYPGELLALVGPNGAGKSTLLRLLNFLEAPTTGRVLYHGRAYTPSTIPLHLRRKITTVFQHPLLLDMSVRRNVSYGLRLRRKKDGREQIERALTAVGLQNLAEAAAHTLSGGEAQRVALARALVLQPEVLLLDEPTANLDPANVRVIEEIITNAIQQQQTTIVLVTHNVWQARRLAQRVAFLFEGELMEVAPTAEFFDAPKNPRTTAFLRGELVY